MIIKGTPENLKRFIQQGLGTDEPEYPRGKISDDDQGALSFAIGIDRKNQCIRIDFNKDVSWLGLDLQTALAVHSLLTTKIADLSQLIIDDERKKANQDSNRGPASPE